jgi:hypothetical protein
VATWDCIFGSLADRESHKTPAAHDGIDCLFQDLLYEQSRPPISTEKDRAVNINECADVNQIGSLVVQLIYADLLDS